MLIIKSRRALYCSIYLTNHTVLYTLTPYVYVHV